MTASWLFERMHGWRADPALVWDGAVSSYGDILDRIAFWHGELDRQNIGAGRVVVVDGGFSPNAVALLLALVERRSIVVPLVPISRVHRPQFVAIAEAQCTIEFSDDDRWTLSHHDRPISHALTAKLIARGNPGLVIFSSGSAGTHRGVLHDFASLLEKFHRPGHRKSTLTFLLFDHIGGIDTLFNTLASGGTVVTAPSRDPEAICRVIAAHRVHTLPTSPTFLNLLLISDAWRNYDMSSLRVIAYGTEAMPENTLKRLAEAFPDVKLVQTYGMSELGVLRSRSQGNDSLWIQFSGDGFETKIVDGTLWVRTPTAMLGYLNAPDLFTPDGWLNTQDAVEVSGDYIRILGRVSELINVGGQKVYPAEVENVILQMPNVRDVSVYGERSPLLGQFVAARVKLAEPEPFDVFRRRLIAFCRERLTTYKVPVRIELTDNEQFGARFKKMRRGVDGARQADAPTDAREAPPTSGAGQTNPGGQE